MNCRRERREIYVEGTKKDGEMVDFLLCSRSCDILSHQLQINYCILILKFESNLDSCFCGEIKVGARKSRRVQSMNCLEWTAVPWT